jgi:transposase
MMSIQALQMQRLKSRLAVNDDEQSMGESACNSQITTSSDGCSTVGKRHRKIKIRESLAELERYRGTPRGEILYAAKQHASDRTRTVAEIARSVGVQVYQVRYVLDQCERLGLALLQQMRGPRVDPQRKATIVDLVRTLARLRDGRPTVKQMELSQALRERYGIKLGSSALTKYRRLAGFAWRARRPSGI